MENPSGSQGQCLQTQPGLEPTSLPASSSLRPSPEASQCFMGALRGASGLWVPGTSDCRSPQSCRGRHYLSRIWGRINRPLRGENWHSGAPKAPFKGRFLSVLPYRAKLPSGDGDRAQGLRNLIST